MSAAPFSRKALMVLLAVAALLGTVMAATAVGSSTDGRGSFTDDDGSVHESDINGLAASGITKGCNPPDNTRYCPNSPVTRAQMASFLVRALDLPAADQNPFTDTGGSVHQTDIAALAQADITKGCNPPQNTRYCPDSPVTRAQMASFLVRALDLAAADQNPFTDTGGSVHQNDIAALAQADITKGCNPPDNTRYCPDSPVTRAQMASFLVRALDGVDPILNRLSLRSGLSCNKDGLACSKRVTLAAGTRLQIREGWYQVMPYEPGEESAFKSGETRLTVSWDGNGLTGDYLGLSDSASPATRMWEYHLPPLTSGTHTLRVAWRWVGDVHQTATITVTVP